MSRVVCLGLALVAMSLAACNDDSTPPSASSEAPAASGTTAPTEAAASESGGESWTTYGGANSRAGVAHGAPAAPKLRKRFTRAVDGEVYAQPLIAGGRIYVASANHTI